MMLFKKKAAQEESSETRRHSVASQSYFRTGEVTEKYRIGEVLGRGNYAEVRLAHNKQTGEKVAIKILQLQSHSINDIMNEIDILARVDDHPNIIQLREIYEKKGRMFVVMEFVSGGELFERVMHKKFFAEQDAREVMRVLFTTISHMHTHGIVHRDLKPENILFSTPDDHSPIKIADFGLAKVCSPCYEESGEGSPEMKTLCGTPGYVAPEVLKPQSRSSGYTAQCDMWSLGVILYVLLCGYPPFQHDNQQKLFKQILKADFHFHTPWWDKVSVQAKDLVCKLLVVDPEKRLTPTEALSHPWMTQVDADSGSMDMKKLEEYVARLHKRKFRMFTRAIAAAHRLELLSTPPPAPRLTERDRTCRMQAQTYYTQTFKSAPQHHSVPPPPPPPPAACSPESPPPSPSPSPSPSTQSRVIPTPQDAFETATNDTDSEAVSGSESRRSSVDSEWVKARQESIARKLERSEDMRRRKFAEAAHLALVDEGSLQGSL